MYKAGIAALISLILTGCAITQESHQNGDSEEPKLYVAVYDVKVTDSSTGELIAEKQVSVKEGASVSASSSTFLSYPFALISHRSDDPVEDTPWRVSASYEKGELRFAFHDGDGGDCGYAARAMDAGCDAGTLSVTLSVFTEEIKNATLGQ